ncbi:MAG: cyclase family protein [Clostridia bacterium]|nr:cyclase family protein [Clostridia bacterium]
MKIYDISQELFSSVVFPGDPAPKKETLASMAEGDLYNLTALSMCAHNGTHVDAPSHFVKDGKSVEEMELSKMVGPAYVKEHNGILTAEDAKTVLSEAEAVSREAAKRLLLKGKTTVSYEAAAVFAEYGIDLIGNESQTVGPEDGPMAVHQLLLGREIVLLEGVRLAHVPDGAYLLSAAPVCLGGVEGSPCRAILIEL